MRRCIVGLTIAAGLLATAVPASAQYYGGYDRPPPPYGYDRRPPPPDEDDYYRPRRPPPPYGYREPGFSRTCITSRGACPTRPSPPGTPCGCEIPGFGYKRGATG